MKTFVVTFLFILIPTSAYAAKPTEVIIIDQPVAVKGSISATITSPVTVNGTVNSNITEPVGVVTPEGISHYGLPISAHIQLQATGTAIALDGITKADLINHDGGGRSFTLQTNQCLVITELEIVYVRANTSSFPSISFDVGLTSQSLSSVNKIRTLADIPDSQGNGKVSKTFPSGLIFKLSNFFPDDKYVAVKSHSAQVVEFTATGYLTSC